jgi:hypothetical protein
MVDVGIETVVALDFHFVFDAVEVDHQLSRFKKLNFVSRPGIRTFVVDTEVVDGLMSLADDVRLEENVLQSGGAVDVADIFVRIVDISF